MCNAEVPSAGCDDTSRVHHRHLPQLASLVGLGQITKGRRGIHPVGHQGKTTPPVGRIGGGLRGHRTNTEAHPRDGLRNVEPV